MTDPAREQRFLTLLNANLAALGRLASSYAGNTGERDDLLQEIALALWQALPRFRGECSERTFLFRIAHNHCINHIVRRRPHGFAAGSWNWTRPTSPAPWTRRSARRRSRPGCWHAVRRLPLIQREVVVLALEDMDYARDRRRCSAYPKPMWACA